MDKKFMNKMDGMEMDKVSGGFARLRNPGFHKPKSNANSMAANVDETQMKLPIGELPVAGGHKINV